VSTGYDDGDDRYEEYKDSVAMGYINEDGTQREPREPDWDAIEYAILYAKHCEETHAGAACDCPVPSQAEIDAAWAAHMEKHLAEDHSGTECDCEAPF
jgi:hypothetical protein